MKTTRIAALLVVLAFPQLARAESGPPADETTAANLAPAPDPYVLRPSAMTRMPSSLLIVI